MTKMASAIFNRMPDIKKEQSVVAIYRYLIEVFFLQTRLHYTKKTNNNI